MFFCTVGVLLIFSSCYTLHPHCDCFLNVIFSGSLKSQHQESFCAQAAHKWGAAPQKRRNITDLLSHKKNPAERPLNPAAAFHWPLCQNSDLAEADGGKKKKTQTTLILHDDIFFNESFYRLRKKYTTKTHWVIGFLKRSWAQQLLVDLIVDQATADLNNRSIPLY